MLCLHLFSKCVILLSCFVIGQVTSDELTDPTDIVIIEELESETEIQKPGEMPSALGFNVRLVHGTSPIHLKLKKNDIGYEQQQVASIRVDEEGDLYLHKENLPTIKNVALYQDNETQAVFTVTCDEETDGQCVLLGSLNVNGEEFDIHPMAKNPGFRRRKRYARRYGDPQKKRNNVMDRYKGSQNQHFFQNSFANTNRKNGVYYNPHATNSVREKMHKFDFHTTNPMNMELEQQMLEYPGEQILDNAQHVPSLTPAPKRRLYAAFKKDPKQRIKSDCVGKNDALKDITPQVLARREKQREVVFQHGASGQQPQPNRNVPREFTMRQNSGAAQDYYVTLVVVVDYSIYMRFYNASTERDVRARDQDAKSKIRMYFAHIVNGIDLRYANIREHDFAINVAVTEYVIADHPNFSPWTNTYVNPEMKYVGVWDALNKLVDWRDTMIKHLPPHDHLMLFTGENLYETRSDDPSVTGYAHVRTVCTKKSASINEDLGGFGGIITATHELAHSLGANHDGETNFCLPTDQYIMTAMGGDTNQANKLNPWKFSDCSVAYFRDYIEELNKNKENCMTDRPMDIDPNFHEVIKEMPGQILGPNEQCKEKLGSGSFYGWNGGLGRYQDICTNMACKNPKKRESFHLYNAARGTSCGNKKWCINGECVFDRNAPEKNDNCVHGDSMKPFPNNGTCAELVANRPSRCYNREYREFCCGSCNAKFTGKKGCEYGDKVASCVLVKSRPYLCYDTKNSQLCCVGCASQHTGIKGCEYGDRKTGCKKDQCHTRDHQLNCCKTCGIQSQISQTSSTASVRPTISVSNQNSHPSSLTTRRQSTGPTDMKPIQNVNKHSILPTTTHMIPFSSTRFSLKIGGNRQEGTPTQNKVQELPAWQQKTTPVDELIPDPFAPGYCVKKNAHYRPDVPCEFLAKWLSLCTETRFKNACCQTCNIDRTRRVKQGCVDNEFCSARTGADCYKKETRDNCCATCSKFETGFMLCPYGDKDARCGLMMRLNKKFYCENYGSTCCESCFKTDRRPEVTTPFPLFISARRPNTAAANRVRSQTQTQSEPRVAASRSSTSTANNYEKVRENLKRFVTFINQIFSRSKSVG